mmetsp:Transcript_139326/g.445506  ORF Transcript_139326/g.445506 Transcript_139326/m.445506 type:complete len:450 (-) Transcript_139326:20-1369(-)
MQGTWRSVLACWLCGRASGDLAAWHVLDGVPGAVGRFAARFVEPSGAVLVLFLSAPEAAVGALRHLFKEEGLAPLFGAVAVAPLDAGAAAGTQGAGAEAYAGEGVERACVLYRTLTSQRRGSRALDLPAWRALPAAPIADASTAWRRKVGPALAAWLRERAYPLVHVPGRGVFPGPKYVQHNPFGLVLVTSRQLASPTSDLASLAPLVGTLAPWAKFYRRRLKFSLFACTSQTAEVCDRLGLGLAGGAAEGEAVEVVIVESPSAMTQDRLHLGGPAGTKYLLPASASAGENAVHIFFESYAAGNLTPHFASSAPTGGLAHVRELRGDEVAEFVAGGGEARRRPALMLFWSSKPGFGPAEDVEERREARQLLEAFESLGALTKVHNFTRLAALDCERNEHPLSVPRLPWVRWFPAGGRGRPVDLEVVRSREALLEFLEDRRYEAEEGYEE